MSRALGWLPPKPDHLARLRYAGHPVSRLLAGVDPAESVDASNLVEILDQGSLGSCTANAIAQIIRAEQLRTGDPKGTEFLSRLWAYSLALARDGNLGRDTGTNLCTVMDMLAQYGFPAESWWPYALNEFGRRPPLEAYHQAFDQRAEMALAYHQITESGATRILAIQQALTSGRLVAFGTLVSEWFCAAAPSGIVMRPKPDDKIAGGHALVWCGYDRDVVSGLWKFRTANSWGDWGDHGFFWMDAEYVTWEETCDIWIVSAVPHYKRA